MLDFMIVYEVEPRELESIIILGNELKCRGYSVGYCSLREFESYKYFAYRWSKIRLRNRIKNLLVPSCYHDKEIMEFFYLPFGKVDRIINLRWEQYFRNTIMDNPASGGFLYPSEGAKDAYHVCWGEVSLQTMMSVNVPYDHLLQTGPLHMDILRSEFLSYFMSKEELFKQFGIDYSKRAVLFISSYANAKDRSSYFKYLDTFFDGKYKIDYDAIELERESYRRTIEWIDSFLSRNPDVIFIWRPHPSEGMTEELQDLQKKHPNFRIISDYSVKQWILTCDTITTWVSTSIVEAYFAKKPCFILRPVEYPYDKDMCVYRNAQFIKTKDDFMGILSKACVNTLNDDYIHKCYDVMDNKPSYIRLADKLEELYKTGKYYPWNSDAICSYNRHERKQIVFRSLCYYTKSFIAHAMNGIKKVTHISFGSKMDRRLELFTETHKKTKNKVEEIDRILAPLVSESYYIRTGRDLCVQTDRST